MLVIRKLLKLPSPLELGRADCDALPSRDLTPDCAEYCWQDWHAEVKTLHPIKYWFAETAADFIKYKIWFRISRPFKNAKYWIVSHVIPSRRYHMLDLRQPKEYSYGWADVPEKILYANFNLLKQYLDEDPYDLSTDRTLEEINADTALKAQYDDLREAKDILYWWTVKRPEDIKINKQLLNNWHNLNKDKVTRQNGEAAKAWEVMKNADQDYEKKIDEMLVRLMKIRRFLWT